MLIFSIIAIAILSATAQTKFSPLSTFYDIDVSTTATFFSGKSFGPGCSLGGTIPDGFIGIAMNGMTMGLNSTASVCGMCIAIRGPPPSSVNPAENQGVVGEYYAYVYETCEECSQNTGIQLGIPGHGQSAVVWRAIPCPSSQGETPFIFFDGAKPTRARFQVRGLSSPITSISVKGKELSTDGSFFVHENTSSVFPFTCDITTALGEQLSIMVPAYREHGKLADLITVKKIAPARSTTIQAPIATSQFGSGEITTNSGLQIRTVKTSNQVGRQVLTIMNSPNEAMVGNPGNMAQPQMASPMGKDSQMRQQGPSDVAMASLLMDAASAPTARRPSLYSPQGSTQETKSDRDQLLGSIDFLNKPMGMDEFSSGKYEQVHVNPGTTNLAQRNVM